MLRKSAIVIYLIVATGALSVGPSHAQSRRVALITTEEAERPRAATTDLTFRAGVSRGPAIRLLSPKSPELSVQSPVHLQFKFEGRGGAQIDVDSFKLIDESIPVVDLTDRVKNFTKLDGIDVPEAEIPPGTYTIHAEIKDRDGRAGFLTFTLNVAKQ